MIPLSEAIAGLRRNQKAFKPALLREVTVAMEAGAKLAKSFIGDENTPGWDPLAASTIAEKARKGYATPAPLRRTGDLAESIEGQAEEVFGGVRGVIGSTDAVVALAQEIGTYYIPPRPFLGPAMILTEPVLQKALGELAVRALTPGSLQ